MPAVGAWTIWDPVPVPAEACARVLCRWVWSVVWKPSLLEYPSKASHMGSQKANKRHLYRYHRTPRRHNAGTRSVMLLALHRSFRDRRRRFQFAGGTARKGQGPSTLQIIRHWPDTRKYRGPAQSFVAVDPATGHQSRPEAANPTHALTSVSRSIQEEPSLRVVHDPRQPVLQVLPCHSTALKNVPPVGPDVFEL